MTETKLTKVEWDNEFNTNLRDSKDRCRENVDAVTAILKKCAIIARGAGVTGTSVEEAMHQLINQRDAAITKRDSLAATLIEVQKEKFAVESERDEARSKLATARKNNWEQQKESRLFSEIPAGGVFEFSGESYTKLVRKIDRSGANARKNVDGILAWFRSDASVNLVPPVQKPSSSNNQENKIWKDSLGHWLPSLDDESFGVNDDIGSANVDILNLRDVVVSLAAGLKELDGRVGK